jgi:hypothetical protein
MGNYGIILMWVFAAIGFAVLNKGTEDEESRRREAFFARFEDGASSGTPAATPSNRGMAGKEIPVALGSRPLKNGA